MVDKYQPQLVWFDWWIEQTVFKPYLQKFAAYYYNQGEDWGKGVAINYKKEAYPADAAVYDIERGQLKGINPHFWQTDTSVSKNSWGYIDEPRLQDGGRHRGRPGGHRQQERRAAAQHRPARRRHDPGAGSRDAARHRAWLAVNGEAIYGTRPWTRFGEGPTEVEEGYFTDTKRKSYTSADVRFTTKDGALYAICLGWPETAWAIQSLGTGAGKVASVALLGSEAALTWKQDADRLMVHAPADKPCEYAFTLKIEFAE